MINIFNRKELYITFSMDEYVRIRGILNDNNIEYYVKTYGRDFWTRGRKGSFGMDMKSNYEYKFFVKRCDHEKALYLIHSRH